MAIRNSSVLCMVHDISFPPKQSVNDGIARDEYLSRPLHPQHEIMNLRLFMLCVKIRKYETFSIRSNSAMRNGP